MVEIRNKSFFEMPVDDIEYILHNHPEYDDEWIYWAAPILSRYYSISLSDLTQLNSSQVKSLWDALLWFPNDEFIIDILLTRGLNSTQMKMITLAYKDGLSRDQIDFLARKEIPYMKLNYIIKALLDGFDMIKILDINAFKYDQIYEIYAGFKDKIDYSIYMDPEMDSNAMKAVRLSLNQGFPVKITNDSVIINEKEKI